MSAVVASIGCSDPWNAAGVGLDLWALLECGARPVTVIAGVTAQDANGVHAAQAVAPDVLLAQLAALEGAHVAAYRIGALLDVATVRVVAAHVRGTRVPAVYDPVFAPSGGGRFVDGDVVSVIMRELIPHVALVTPNLGEAAQLTGSAALDTVAAMERAAALLFDQGAAAALVKGGHLTDAATDVLVDALGTVRYDAPRIAGSMRGSGCLLACGIAAALASGAPLRGAIARGRAFVRGRLANVVEFGGMRVAF